jgi:hypothetical protein
MHGQQTAQQKQIDDALSMQALNTSEWVAVAYN